MIKSIIATQKMQRWAVACIRFISAVKGIV